MSLHYTVNNPTGTPHSMQHLGRLVALIFRYCIAGDAYVYINGEKFRVRDHNVRAGLHHTVPISVILKKQNVLTFSIESDDESFEAHLDGIEVLDGTEEEIVVEL